MSWTAALLGARVRRIDAAGESMLALTLVGPSVRGVLLLGLGSAARGVGWADARPAGRIDHPFVLRARSCLGGGRVVAVDPTAAGGFRLAIERGAARFTLEAVLRGAQGNALLCDAHEQVIASLRPVPAAAAVTAPPREASGPAIDLDLEQLRPEGQRLLASMNRAELEQAKVALARDLRRELRQLERRLLAVEGDLQRGAEAVTLRRNATLLLANLSTIARGAAAAELLDESEAPPKPVRVAIDRALGPARQADAWFHRARKLERGVVLATERAAATRDAIARLQARLTAIEDAPSLERLAQLAPAPAAEPRATSRSLKGKRNDMSERRPYRRYLGSGGRAILVGRNAAANDRLTLHHARPHDLWLHARDEGGAHVVVPLERGESCPPELLCDAATLAAHFSQARGHARVDVVYTARRYLQKPRKAPTGTVELLREKVFHLELEPARLRRLLDSETPGA